MAESKSVLKNFGGLPGVTFLVVGFIAVASFSRWRTSSSGDAMRKVGEELGLQVSRAGQRWELRGRIDDIGVAVKTTTDNLAGDTYWYTDFELYAPNQPHGRIVGASLRQKAMDGLQGSDWQGTGDKDFDDAVFADGDPAKMIAGMDAEARGAVRAAADAGWALESVTWKAREAERMTSATKIRALLDLGLAAAKAMGRADDLPANDAPASRSVTPVNALEALAEVNTPRSLEAALELARSGDDRQEVRNRLVSAVFSGNRLDEVISALGDVGGQVEIAVLRSVKGEHAGAAKSAIAAIEKRL